MSKPFKTIILCSLAVIGIFLVVDKAEAAILSVTPQYDEISYGTTFIADVRLNSEREIINAIQATITYPANVLDVVDVSRGGSFLTLWAQEPTVDEVAGTITLAGGIPHGSYVVDGRVLSITFRAQSSGSVEVGFDQEKTSVHLNDGQGTKAKTEFKSAIYKIKPAVLIDITSPTHPNENSWYRNNSPIFEWVVKPEAEYSYTLTSDRDKIPNNRPEVTVGEVSYTDLPDGVYYFILNEKQPKNNWAVAGRRRVMIDTTPPLPVEVVVSQDKTVYNGQYFLAFSTSDRTSGIDYYDVLEGGKTYRNKQSPYLLKDQSLKKTITVRAFDKAGNSVESSFGAKPEKLGQSSNKYILISVILVIFAVVIILAIFLSKLGQPS